MSSDVFNKFKDANGKFKDSDIKGIISLHEATQFRINGDAILDEALTFTKPELQSIASHSIDPHLSEYIVNALNYPNLKDVQRLEERKFIYFYEMDASRNKTLHEFAKYDFNWIQMLHQQELIALCSWWKEENMASKFTYIRNRVVDSYFTAVGYYFEPRYARARYIFDVTAMDKLPADYLKLLYKTILDVHDEFKKTAEANYEQPRWVHEGYQPTFHEFLESAMIAARGNATMAQVLIGIEEADENEYQRLINTDNIIYKAIDLFACL
ncbi:probable terpene synthase 6 [Hibiscus syriacus]|uniref:probable terpene synthase 6 n=1 Tax=Hibiscus syriacus TaxID=106335 RepID=UPI0019225FC2|nr:probable terpene synthase 6 [Hibiscus syriacus]